MTANSRTALILVAHADDETLGAGGTIPRLVRQGWRVEVAILSDTVRYGGGGVSNREGAEAACQILGVHELHFLDVPDQKFDAIPLADLSQRVMDRSFAPDLIITHADRDLNLDHRLTCDVAKILGRPRDKPVSILSCEIPNTAFWNGHPFAGNFFVDIEETLPLKVQAFEQYVNEIREFPHPWSSRGLELLAQFHGVQCGLRCAEAFHIVRAYEGSLPG